MGLAALSLAVLVWARLRRDKATAEEMVGLARSFWRYAWK